MNIDQIAEEFLFCRDFRHAWEPYNARVSRSKITRRNEIHQILICSRCGALKTRFLSPAGDELRQASMSYPKGYLLKDQGPLTPADRAMIRALNLKRSMGDAS